MKNGTEERPSIPLEMSREEFVAAGYWLIDQLADHFTSLQAKPVAHGETPATVQRALKTVIETLPDQGLSGQVVLQKAVELLMNHSLLPGHPRFWGYIIGAGTQVGVLSEMLAATINPNVGGWNLSPMATEMEKQVINWIADFIGYPHNAGGLLVSGGAMANYVAFLTARKAKASWKIREQGVGAGTGRLKVYCSSETHTWIQKATDLFGMGTDSISWIDTDDQLRLDVAELEQAITIDQQRGDIPFLVIATAGTVSTGTVDSLKEIGRVCEKHSLWYHIDGAYGGPAAALPELHAMFEGLAMADSIALDPHKWFYCPLEAGCILIKKASALPDTFSYRPPYYHFEDYDEAPGLNFYEYGLQNSRGFRALNVWTGFLQAGKQGMVSMIRHDIEMAHLLYSLISQSEDFEPFQVHLSITTFRYKPKDKDLSLADLNALNERLMVAVQNSGKAFLTNCLVHGKFFLRTCIVNFRTTEEDIRSLPAILRETAQTIISQQELQST
jgi:glutamate/tyrosine decarboxylase-like PLP-dependent enzyme